MSKKLAIMRRLTTLLEGVEGYTFQGETVSYALTGAVFRGRKFLGTDEIKALGGTAISIMEAPRPQVGDEAGNGIVRRADWTLNVQGFTIDDKVNPSDPAYLLAEAIRQRLNRVIAVNDACPTTGAPGEPLYPDDYLLGRLVVDMTMAESIVLPAQENLSAYAFCYTPIVFSLVTDARS